jgi:Stage II sporulation protein E (SpoIIE)
MSGAKRRRGAAFYFIRTLWMQPLWAIPFALFFTMLFGTFPQSLVQAYLISLVFAYCIGYALWAVRLIDERWLSSENAARSRLALVRQIALYMTSCTIASLVAAWIIHNTLLPGFMGGARQIMVVLMFNVVFAGLGTAVAYAFVFYRDAVERAKSDQELNLARRIQRGFLLSQFPERPTVEVFAVNVSSKQVSGDFYDVVPAGDDGFLLAVADVSGKGVPAALLSSMLQASLRTQAPSIASVGEILRNVNTLVCGTGSSGQFATFFLARVDEARMTIASSNAGHNFPVLFRADGTRATLETGGTVVGIMDVLRFDEETHALAPGDRLVIYTDGITEAANARNELFEEERLYALVEALPRHLSAREIVEAVLQGVRTWLDGLEPGDDMTVMVLRVLEPAPQADGSR